MFNNLPWFKRRKVIGFTVSCEQRYLRLLNKEWFALRAGRYLILKEKTLNKKDNPSNWHKTAQNLKLTTFHRISWKFLGNCVNINSAHFLFKPETPIDVFQLEEYVFNSNITSISLDFCENGTRDLLFQLVKGISKQLKILKINCENLDYQKLLTFENPRLSHFYSFGANNHNLLERLDMSMPTVEHLFVNTCSYVFEFPDKGLKFYALKSLVLSEQGYARGQPSNLIDTLFELHFPILANCELFLHFDGREFYKLSQSMPKLKTFSIDLSLNQNKLFNFPDFLLTNLKELNLTNSGKKQLETNTTLNMNNLPQLCKLGISSEIELSIDEISNLQLITALTFFKSEFIKYRYIIPKLSSVNKVTIDCYFCQDCLFQVFETCKIMIRLNLYSMQTFVYSKHLPEGPFKTTTLSLSGSAFLTNDLAKWMAGQPQLINLSLKVYSKKKNNLVSVFFPYLLHLTVQCNSINEELYLRSKLTY